jgi:hypothetical protein
LGIVHGRRYIRAFTAQQSCWSFSALFSELKWELADPLGRNPMHSLKEAARFTTPVSIPMGVGFGASRETSPTSARPVFCL